jgi:alpha-glucosidase
VGVFSPFCRNHKGCDMPDGEPWAYGEEAENISRKYIGLRYRMMPYLYSLFYEATQTGVPVARSLCLNYPYDENVYNKNFQYQFLFGDALMVTPVVTNERSKQVYLPRGEWYDLFTDSTFSGGEAVTQAAAIDKIPLLVKASAIIPMQSLVQSAKEKPSDTLFLHIYSGDEKNSFIWYEDAGDGFEYRQAAYNKRVIEFDPASHRLLIQQQEGNYSSVFKKIQVIFHGFKDMAESKVNEKKHTIVYTKQTVFSLAETGEAKEFPSVICDNDKKAISVTWK